ncbi:MAG: hypothetical protein AB7H97_10030 [Pseudobdellovibrionaceae bacterium]
MKSRQEANCYCAFCKSPRRIFTKKKIGILNVILSLVSGLALGYLIFMEFDPRALLFSVMFLALAEGFIQLRWRLSVICSQCGFDFVLYVKTPSVAAEKVRLHLENRKNDPRYLLATPLNLPAIKVPPKNQKAESGKPGRLLSK